MNEPMLLPVKPGTLKAADKAALRKAGVIVIEHENPNELRLLRPYAEIGTSGMLAAAMKALMRPQGDYVSHAQRQFALEIANAVVESHASKK